MALKHSLILASGSPRRVDLLHQAGIEPARLMPMDIDETPKKAEHPRSLARRLSAEKGEAAFARHLDAQVGTRLKVLTERGGIGRTEQFTAVRLAAPVTHGRLLDLTMAGHNGRQLLAA